MNCVRMMLAVGAMVFAVGCGKSSSQLCNDAIVSGCMKTVTCFPGVTTQDACVSQAKSQTNCDAAPCPSGETYDSGKAQQCADDYGNISCADLQAGNIPVSCTQVCK